MRVNLDEAIAYLRELLCMNKTELLREIGDLPKRAREKIKKADLITFAFERKFRGKARLPMVAQAGANFAFGTFSLGV